MKNTTPRRAFLIKTTLATAGATLLTSAFSETFASSPFEGYNPYASNKKDLRTNFLGEQVAVTGILYDATSLVPVKNAIVEVWHLSPNSSKYRHRTKLTTDEKGAFSLKTDFPNKESGKYSRIYFKTTTNVGSRYGEIVLNSTGVHITDTHWTQNQKLGKRMFPKYSKYLNTTNISINLLN